MPSCSPMSWRCDAGVIEGGDGAGLALEALAKLRPVGDVRGQDLDGDGALEARVAALVDLAHAPCAY